MNPLTFATRAFFGASCLLLLAFACTSCGPAPSQSSPATVSISSPVQGEKVTALASIQGTYALTSGSVASVSLRLLRDSDNTAWNGSAWVVDTAAVVLPATFNTTTNTWQNSGPMPAGSGSATGLVPGNYGIEVKVKMALGELALANGYFTVGTPPPPIMPITYGWGYNSNGETGTGTGSSLNLPTKVPTNGALDGKFVIDVAAGAEHTLALTTEGKVYAWGYNGFGQLGTGSFSSSSVPVPVNMGGALSGKRVVGIGAGDYHGFAITSDHLVFAWGRNEKGELGGGISGGYYSSPTPVALGGALAGKVVTDITGGDFFSLARTSDGRLYSWGDNTDGQLGTGNNTASNVPVEVTGFAGKLVAKVDAGVFHALVLTTDGTVYAFGRGTDGTLGNGGTAASNVPVAVGTSGAMAGKTIIQVSATRHHCLALSNEGKVYAWGANTAFGLGDGGVAGVASTPIEVGGALTGELVSRIGTGWLSSYAFTSENKMFSWGINFDGNLAGAAGFGVGVPSPTQSNTTNVLTESDSLLTMGGGWRHAVMLTAPRTAYAPEIAVEARQADIERNGTIGFGSNGLGSQMVVPVIVRNRGNAPLTSLTLGVTGSDFTVGPLPQTTLDAGAEMEFDAVFQPTAAGARGGVLTLTSNDPDESRFQLNLTGSGLPLGDLVAGFGAPVISGPVYATVVQTDDKILIGGVFSQVGGITRNSMARLNADGSLDSGFNPNVNGQVNAIALQRDGKIVIGGLFTQVGGVTRNRIARLESNGALDTTFNPNADASVNCLYVTADDKILVGGSFSNMGASSPDLLVRLLPNGTVDPGFNPLISGGLVRCVTVQSAEFSNLILIGGSFSNVGGLTRRRIARLETDGFVDSDFTADALNGVVYGVQMMPDGRILAAGEFDTVNGVARNRIVRLAQSNGAVDGTFNPNVAGSIYSLALQADGGALIAGTISSVGGTARTCVARIKADGTLDADFHPAAGVTSPVVNGATILKDGTILLAGSFTTINGVTRNNFARLTNVNATQLLETNIASAPGQILWHLNDGSPQTMDATLEKSTDGGGTWTLIGPGARLAPPQTGWQWFSPGALPASGQLRLRAMSQGGYNTGSGSLVQTVVPYNGPPVLKVDYDLASNLPNFSTVDFGPVRSGQAEAFVFTFTNTGGTTMTGLADGVWTGDGVGEFQIYYRPMVSTLAPGDSMQAILVFTPRTPGPHTATLTLPTNSPASPSYAIQFKGLGGLPIGTWRAQNFGQSDNAGASMDTADPDGDGRTNLEELALGLDPNSGAGPAPWQVTPNGGNFFLDYSRNRLALTEVSCQVEWSDTLAEGDWHITGVSESVTSETSTTQQVRAVFPAGTGGRRFVRVRITRL